MLEDPCSPNWLETWVLSLLGWSNSTQSLQDQFLVLQELAPNSRPAIKKFNLATNVIPSAFSGIAFYFYFEGFSFARFAINQGWKFLSHFKKYFFRHFRRKSAKKLSRKSILDLEIELDAIEWLLLSWASSTVMIELIFSEIIYGSDKFTKCNMRQKGHSSFEKLCWSKLIE